MNATRDRLTDIVETRSTLAQVMIGPTVGGESPLGSPMPLNRLIHIQMRLSVTGRTVDHVAATTGCVFCGRAWEPGRVRHSNEHVWPQWIRKHAGNIPAERFKASLGLMMDPGGRSFNELPLMVARGRSSILHTVTREVCQDCNHELGRLEQAVEPVFLALAQAAEDGAPVVLEVDRAQLLARWAEKMAVTNELTSDFPKVATAAMGQALLRGDTIRSAVVWAARHPAGYALLTALSHPVITGSETPSPYDYERHATLTAITYHFLSLLVFIPGAGSGPFMQVNTPPFAPEQWTRIWPVRQAPEFPSMETVDGRGLEAAVTDFRRWLLMPRAMRVIQPSPVRPQIVQRN